MADASEIIKEGDESQWGRVGAWQSIMQDLPEIGRVIQTKTPYNIPLGYSVGRVGEYRPGERVDRRRVTVTPIPTIPGNPHGWYIGQEYTHQPKHWRYLDLPVKPGINTFDDLFDINTEENNMFGNLWAGSLRVKDGFIPVIYQGNEEDGPEDSIIYWQGDLSKPFTDDEGKYDAKDNPTWKQGYRKAREQAQKVLDTFLADGIEKAAKKVTKDGD